MPAPEGNSVLVANPADRIIYYYSEGMAAPMGSFQNYRRKPRAVMVVDRSLRETTSGVYSTTTKLPKSGVYDVAFLLDSPRVTHCFSAEAKPNPDVRREKQVAIRIEYLNKDKQLRVGENYKLRFKLVDTTTLKAKSDLKDVRVLTLLSSGTWQKRDFARSVGDGVYELDIKVPQTGLYFVFVESRSQGVSFRQLPYLTLQTAAQSTASNNPKEKVTKIDMKHMLLNRLTLGLARMRACVYSCAGAEESRTTPVKRQRRKPSSRIYSCPMHPDVKAKRRANVRSAAWSCVSSSMIMRRRSRRVSHDVSATQNEYPGYRTAGPERTEDSFLYRSRQRPDSRYQFHLYDLHDDLSAARRNLRTRAKGTGRQSRSRRSLHFHQRRSGDRHSRTAQSLGRKIPRR